MTGFNRLKTSGLLGTLLATPLGALSERFVALGASDRIVLRRHGARPIDRAAPALCGVAFNGCCAGAAGDGATASRREMQPWSFAA